MNDSYELPKHYQHLGIKPWDFAEANHLTFTEGCIIKYLSRYKHKEDGLTDLYKARLCLEQLIKREIARRQEDE